MKRSLFCLLCLVGAYGCTTPPAGEPETGAPATNAVAAVQDDDSDFWVADVPPLPGNKQIVVCIGDNASPAETDSTNKFYYSSHSNKVFSTELLITKFSDIMGTP